MDQANASRVEIRYQCADRVVTLDDLNATILDLSIAHKISHHRECGGNARCTTCRVRILDGIQNVSPPGPDEAELRKSRGWDDFTRLACQTKVTGNVTIQRLIRTGADVSRLQVETLPNEHGEERPLAILFCDMRNFTPFVETHLAYDVVHILNRFFSGLGEPILLNNGVIYQYVGDEITALFGVGGQGAEQSCLAAVRAGLGMQKALQRLNAELLRDFGTELAIGIGIHFGPVIVGHIGHQNHRQFAVVGDVVNVASRTQAANKDLGTQLLVTENVLSQLPLISLKTGKSALVSLKGKSDQFTLFEFIGFGESDPMSVVQETFGQLFSPETRFATIFYQRLFSIAPEIRQLFRGNIETQGEILNYMIQTLVYASSRPETMALGLQALGRQHARYGVEAEHYLLVRQALLETIPEVLGDTYSPRVGKAWESLFDSVLSLMSGRT